TDGPIIHEFTGTPMDRSVKSEQPAAGFQPDARLESRNRAMDSWAGRKFRGPAPELDASDPHFQAIDSKVASGPERGDEPISEADIRQLEWERDQRRGREKPREGDRELRPGEGFVPK